MAKAFTKTSSTFVAELTLVVSAAFEGVLLSRLEAARQMYNACLGEAMKRVRLIRQSKDFQKARSLKPSNPERKVLFKLSRERYEFSDYAIQSYGTRIRHSSIADHLDAHTGQKIATRAKNYLGSGDTGIDIGSSTIAVVSDTDVQLRQFASELEFDAAHIRRLQRKMDRSRRKSLPRHLRIRML